MPTFAHDGATLHYTDEGEGPPVLLLAPGGMRSAIERWSAAPWNPLQRLSGVRRIAMDQRNAGASRGPIAPDHGWATYTGDQLALLDHLGIAQCRVVGMCIGGPFGLSLCLAGRVVRAVLLQPIGRSADNGPLFDELFDAWARDLAPAHPQVDWAAFRARMFGGDFVFAHGEAEVAACTTPLLVLGGTDRYHPPEVARAIAAQAPRALLLEGWKRDLAATDQLIRGFLDLG